MELKYNVGDLYDVDGRKGIVFKVSDDGLHGLIISLDEVRLPWVGKEFIKDKIAELTIGASDENDGVANLCVVMGIDSWREKYPAFAWCADHGSGWYLPSKNEAAALFTRSLLCEKISKALYANGGIGLELGADDYPWYLTSTEAGKSNHDDTICIWAARMHFNEINLYSKSIPVLVRAIAAF